MAERTSAKPADIEGEIPGAFLDRLATVRPNCAVVAQRRRMQYVLSLVRNAQMRTLVAMLAPV
jgi:hypothetical protein